MSNVDYKTRGHFLQETLIEDRIVLVRQMAKEGKPASAMCEATGLTASGLYEFMRKYGIALPVKPKGRQTDWYKEAWELRKTGLKVPQIALRIGQPKGKVSGFFQRVSSGLLDAPDCN